VNGKRVIWAKFQDDEYFIRVIRCDEEY